MTTAVLLSATSVSATEITDLSPEEALESAGDAFQSQDYKRAFNLVTYASENGLSDAYTLLGLAYSHGLKSSDFYANRMIEIREFAIANEIPNDDKKALELLLKATSDDESIWTLVGELYGTSKTLGPNYDKAIEALKNTRGNADRIREFEDYKDGKSPLSVNGITIGDKKSRHRNCNDVGKCKISNNEVVYVDYDGTGYNSVISKIWVTENLPIDADESNLNAIIDTLSVEYDLNSAPTKTELANHDADLRTSVDWFYRDYTIQVTLKGSNISIIFLNDRHATLAKEAVDKERSSLSRILEML